MINGVVSDAVLLLVVGLSDKLTIPSTGVAVDKVAPENCQQLLVRVLRLAIDSKVWETCPTTMTDASDAINRVIIRFTS